VGYVTGVGGWAVAYQSAGCCMRTPSVLNESQLEAVALAATTIAVMTPSRSFTLVVRRR